MGMPPARPRRHRAAIVVSCIVVALIAVGAVVTTYVLGFWGAGNIVAFGSPEGVRVTRELKIKPAASRNAPLDHYFARISEATNANGSALDVFGYPRLEVNTSDGFSLSDFSSELPAGTYTLTTTDDQGTERTLPPLYVPADGNATDSGTSGSAPTKDASGLDALVVVPPDDLSVRVRVNQDTAASNSARRGKYGAFLAVLQDLEQQYGSSNLNVELSTSGYMNAFDVWGSGVAFAKLVDFGDGVERLLVAAASEDSAGTAAADNGGYDLLVYEYHADTDSATQVLNVKAPANHMGNITFYLTTGASTQKDGVHPTYLRTYEEASVDFYAQSVYYGLLDDGSFGMVARTKTILPPGGAGVSYEVNGQVVDKSTLDLTDNMYDSSDEGYELVSIGVASKADAEKTETGGTTLRGGTEYGPQQGINEAADLTGKLTNASTNSDTAETKVIGGDAADENAVGESGAASTDTAPETSTETAPEMPAPSATHFEGSFSFGEPGSSGGFDTSGQSVWNFSFERSGDTVTVFLRNMKVQGTIVSESSFDDATDLLTVSGLTDVKGSMNAFQSFDNPVLTVLVPKNATADNVAGTWAAALRGISNSQGYYTPGTPIICSTRVQIGSDGAGSYSTVFVGASSDAPDYTIRDASTIDWADPTTTAYDIHGSAAASVQTSKIGPQIQETDITGLQGSAGTYDVLGHYATSTSPEVTASIGISKTN